MTVRTAAHPRGLAVLSLTEACERFSFYGMQALLVLYMATTLLPAAPERRVWGFAAFRGGIEAVFGPLPDQALASQIFGLYAGLVYLTPMLGGLVGDRWLGARRTVLLGAALMATGHFLLAFDRSFLVALAALILGSGCLKGNIATQVGRLYGTEDTRRDRAFLLFNLGINLGAFAGPLICGAIGAADGWHAGFATAGFGMLGGIAAYLSGWRRLPADRPRTAMSAAAVIDRSPTDGRRIAASLALIALSLFYNLPYGQSANVLPLWIAEAVDRSVGGRSEIPVAWSLASDGLVTVLATPLVMWLWKRQAARGRKPDVAGKIAVGCALAAAANALLAILSTLSPGPHTIGIGWSFAYFLMISTGYLFVMPVLLAAVSRGAPPRLVATMMGLVYAGLFVANLADGWIARFYDPLRASGFWTVQAAIGGCGVLVAIALRHPLAASLGDDR